MKKPPEKLETNVVENTNTDCVISYQYKGMGVQKTPPHVSISDSKEVSANIVDVKRSCLTGRVQGITLYLPEIPKESFSFKIDIPLRSGNRKGSDKKV